MRRFNSFSMLLLILFAQACILAADWPQFLGPNRNGISPERGFSQNWRAQAPKIHWQVPLSDNGFAGPAAAMGRVFILDHQSDQDIVRALDINNGKQIWEYRYRDASGDNYGFSRSTPTIAGGKVYTISRMGWVLCVDARNGKKVWSRNLIKEFGGVKPTWDYSMSALIDGKQVIVCPGGRNASVAALDANTGTTIWQGGGSDIPGYATPVPATINRVRQYVVFTGKSVIGVDAKGGKLLWRFPWVTPNDVNAATPIVSGNTVFITSGYNAGCALLEINGKNVRVKWQNKSIQSHFTTPILAGGYLYSTTDPNKLVCLDMRTGKVRWEHNGFEKGGQMAVNSTIFAFEGSNGNLVMVKMTPNGYQELGRIRPLGGQSWTAPILANGKLIVRNTKTLACLDLK